LLTLSGASRSAQKKVVCRVFKPPQLRPSEVHKRLESGGPTN
jgi:hypothetical protein